MPAKKSSKKKKGFPCRHCSRVLKSKAGRSSHERSHSAAEKKQSSAKKSSAKKMKKKQPAKAMKQEKKMQKLAVPNVCRSCHALPAGAVELVSLLIVVVVALTAVLFTSVYALQQQGQEIAQLQYELQVQQ